MSSVIAVLEPLAEELIWALDADASTLEVVLAIVLVSSELDVILTS